MNFEQFLGCFAKLRETTVAFVMSVAVLPFVRKGQPRSHERDFHEISYLRIFRKFIDFIKI